MIDTNNSTTAYGANSAHKGIHFVPPTLPDDLWLVEYNAEQHASHVDELRYRLERNAGAFIRDGKQAGDGWTPIAIVQGHENAVRAAVAFAEAMEKKHGKEANSGIQRPDAD